MGAALTILAIIGGVISTVFIGLLKDEVAAWLPSITHKIVNFSANIVPEEDRARRREEWLAHIEEYPGKLSQFLQSIMLIFAGINLNKAVIKKLKLFSTFFVVHVFIGGGMLIVVTLNPEKQLKNSTWVLFTIIILLASILFSAFQYWLHFKALDIIRKINMPKR